MKKDDLEDLFKKSFENFEAEVNPGVWKNIQTGLKGAGIGVFAKMLFNKIGTNAIVAIVSSAATVVGTVLVMNYTGNKSEPAANNTTPAPVTKEVTEKPVPVSVNQIKNFLANSDGTAASKEAAIKKDESENDNSEATIAANKKDKKEIQKAINELSGDRIASISSSVVGGAVPLIVNLTNAGTGKINKWSFNDGTKSIVGANPIKVFDEPGIYTVMLNSTGVDGKSSVDSVKIEVTGNSSVTSIPAEFSPNGDNSNDVFIFHSENVVDYNATVFDGNGKIYFDYTGIDGRWDGTTLKGAKAKEGIYYYIFTAVGKDGKKYERKGKIKLTR